MYRDNNNLRDHLEINVDGRTQAEEKGYQQQKGMERLNSYKGTWLSRLKQKTSRLSMGRFKRNKGRGGYDRYRGDSEYGLVYGVIAVIVGLMMFGLVYNLFNGNLVGWQRGMFSTLEEDHGLLTNEILGAEEKLKDSYKKPEERIEKSKYDKNKIRDIKLLDKQPYQEYLVYVYSTDEMKNGAFNKYVKLAEREDSTFPVPIYRVSTEITDDSFVVDTLGEDNPGFIIYRDNTGEVELDSYILDPELFGGIEEYINELIKEDDEYLKNKVGSYNKSVWNNGEEVEVNN